MNKIGYPTYLSNYKESLLFTASDIEVCHGPSLDSNSILDHLQRSIKAVKFWCGDNEILNNVTLQVFLIIRQLCEWKGESVWNPNKVHGVSNV